MLVCLSGVLSHMLKLSILFPLQKWDFSKWLAVATVQQLLRFGEGASWPLAPGEGHPRRGVGGVQGRGARSEGDSLVAHS